MKDFFVFPLMIKLWILNVRERSISRTDSSANRPENYFCHAAFIDLAVRWEERKSNSLHAAYYFLYRMF